MSAANLNTIFNYNPETGTIKRIKNNILAGTVTKYGYRQIYHQYKCYRSGRLAWYLTYGTWPNQIDHINHDKLDDRLINLRNVTNTINNQNKPLQKNNTSRIHGVCWDKTRKKWKISIETNKHHKNLARTIDFFEACCIRKAAEVEWGFHPNHGFI